MACRLALTSWAGRALCQSLADTAGNIISPTAIRVPRV